MLPSYLPRRTAPAALLALAACLLTPTTATADVPGLVVPTMRVEVYGAGTSTFTVCGIGQAWNASPVQWLLTVEGVRVAGLPIAETRVSSSHSVNLCAPVPKQALAGAGTATFSFVGVGTEVAGTFGGYFAWAPGRPDVAGGSGIT